MRRWWANRAANYLRRKGYVVLFPGWRGIVVGDCIVTGTYELMTVVPTHHRRLGNVIALTGGVIDLTKDEGEEELG